MKKSRNFWTKEEISYLADHYADMTSGEIAQKLGRPVCSVYGKAKLLGLHKSEAFYASDKSKRLNGITGSETRFKKGMVSWNKGKHYEVSEAARYHHFPKGH